MNKRLQSIRSRLQELARRDAGYGLFGASTHRYELFPPLTEDKVRSFELLHGVRLPEDYREFLLRVGSGGAGPYYGLHSLGKFEHAFGHLDGLEEEPDGWRQGVGLKPGFLASPFPDHHVWSEPPEGDDEEGAEELMEKWEKETWDDQWVAGTLCVAEMGCNNRQILVVSGDERGHIWTDIRCDGGGLHAIRPNIGREGISSRSAYIPLFLKAEAGQMTFLDWYEWWLDWSLKEIGQCPVSREN